MIAHCLFEQSGTFKNEFKKLGYEAYDYDIQNEFGETNYVIDLFEEINVGYDGKPSIFDNISQDDLMLAFFPCTRFEARVPLLFRGQATQQKSWSDEKKLEYSITLQNELTELYVLLCKLVIIAIRKELNLVIENPYTQPHYLTTYWCLQPTLIDKDRTKNGDYYKKPTQYWFVNFKPHYNLVFEPITYHGINKKWENRTMDDYSKTGAKTIKEARSMIHSQYANRFIRQYLIDEKELSE